MDVELTKSALASGSLHTLIDFDVFTSDLQPVDNAGLLIAQAQNEFQNGQFAEAAESFLRVLVTERIRSVGASHASIAWKYALCKARVYKRSGPLSACLEYQLAAIQDCPQKAEQGLALEYLKTLFAADTEPPPDTAALTQFVDALDIPTLSPTSVIPWALVRLLALPNRCLGSAISLNLLRILLQKTDAPRSLYENGNLPYEIERRLSDDHTRRLGELHGEAVQLLQIEPPGIAKLGQISESLIRAIRLYSKVYASPDQRKFAYEPVVEVLRQLHDLSDESDKLVQIQSACSLASKSIKSVPGQVTTLLLLSVSFWMQQLLNASIRALTVQIQVGQSRKYLPLHRIGSTLEAAFDISNRGTGEARDIDLLCTTDESVASVEILDAPESLSSGANRRVLLKVRPKKACDAIDVELLVEWTNPDGTPGSATAARTAHGQQWVKDQDWLRLRQENPYPLSWIEDPARLRGRGAIVERLLRGARNKELLRIYGEKRVGKTSIARVVEKILAHDIQRSKYLPVYLEWGRMNRRNAGEVGESVCLAALEAFQKQFFKTPRVVAPELTAFREQLGPAARFLEHLTEAEQLDRIVLMLDDCEYMRDLAFLHGDERNQFFQALKSLANTKGLVLFLIGSESFRHLFSKQMSSIVNIGDVVEVAYISDADGERDLVIGPAADTLRFADDAFDLIVKLSAGNPWFSNKICNDIYDRLVAREDGYVTTDDVREVTDSIARERGLRGNFAHLWEESIPFEPGSEEHGRALTGAVLLAVSKYSSSHFEYAPDKLVAQETQRYEPSGQEVKRTLVALTASGVLEEKDDRGDKTYRIRIGLFHQWLRGIGRPELESELEERFGISDPDKSLRPTEAEIIEIADRHWRRVDGRLIGTVEIQSWLAAFDTPKRQRLAYKLLSALTYFDEIAVRRKLTNLMESVKARLIKVRYGARNMPLNIFVTCGDEEPKSGATVLRLLNQAYGGTIRCGGSAKLKSFLQESSSEDEPRAVVLVNDFIGTGESADREIATVAQAIKENAAKDITISLYYLAVAGFQTAITRIMTESQVAVQVMVDDCLLDSDRAFSEEKIPFSPLAGC